MRLSLAAMFVGLGCVAWAAGYDDYIRGYEARRAGNYELALTSFSAALGAGDLAPTYLPDAYIGRADALLRKNRCAEAAADLDAALTLRPNTLDALTMRSHANVCLGKADAALADLDRAIAAAPVTGLYAYRADYKWFRGDFAGAADDYLQAVKLQPKRAYEPRQGVSSLIWYAVSAVRAKTFDPVTFGQLAHDLDADEWPGPVMAYIGGKITLEAVYKEAARGDGDVPAMRKCAADFFIGEWQVANADPSGKALLHGVAAGCPKAPAFANDARIDLKRLP